MKLHSSDPFGPQLSGTGSFGSRSLISHGAALYQGALEVVEKARKLAADKLEASAGDIDFANGRFVVKGTDLGVSLAELAASHTGADANPLDTTTKLAVSAAFPSGAHIAEVEIDPGTGRCEIVRYTAVDDCGVVYNHKIVEGQMLGGLMQGIGQVMSEHLVYDPESGQLLAGSFMDYAMPRADALVEPQDDRPSGAVARQPARREGCGRGGGDGIGSCPGQRGARRARRRRRYGHVEMPYTPQRIWEALAKARLHGAINHRNQPAGGHFPVAELIPFPRRERPEPEPLAAETVVRRPSREELRSADRRRMLENLAALIFIVGFMALAMWVFDRVSGYSKALDCMQYRHNKTCK